MRKEGNKKIIVLVAVAAVFLLAITLALYFAPSNSSTKENENVQTGVEPSQKKPGNAAYFSTDTLTISSTKENENVQTGVRPSQKKPVYATYFSTGTLTINVEGKAIAEIKAADIPVGWFALSSSSFATSSAIKFVPLSNSYHALWHERSKTLYFSSQLESGVREPVRAIGAYELSDKRFRLVLGHAEAMGELSDLYISDNGVSLAAGLCLPAKPNGCYGLSTAILALNVRSGKEIGRVGESTNADKAPKNLFRFVGWQKDGSFAYRIYRHISDGQKTDITTSTETVNLGPPNGTYVFSSTATSTFSAP